MPNRFLDKTVLITGAVGGLGSAMVHAFAAEGARVVVAARKAEQGFALAKEAGNGAIFVRLDLDDEAYSRSSKGPIPEQSAVECCLECAGCRDIGS